MKLPARFKRYTDIYFNNAEDPIKDEKRMVSFIQQLVGIHNVFGDKRCKMSALSLFAMILFGGVFLYVGTFSQFVYMSQVFPDKVETFKAINCVSATSIPLSKYIFMWTSRDRLKVIFEISCQSLSSIPIGSSAHTKMTTALQRARYASWLVVFNQVLTHVTYLLVPFLFTVFGNDRYLPTTPGESYGLSPKYETPFYEMTFVLTCIATAFSAINQTGYIVLYVTLIAHELGHFYAITGTLNDIHHTLTEERNATSHENVTDVFIKEERQKSVDKMLRFCVKHHQFLMKYHHKIKDLYKIIFGAHFFMMTIVIVTTLQTLNAWDIQNTILTAVTGIMPLFLYCFGGELLISAGREMSAAIYSCGWQIMETKQARIVLFMLHLSHQPLSLSAADIFVMNRETFGNVAQVVYKIYAVFN